MTAPGPGKKIREILTPLPQEIPERIQDFQQVSHKSPGQSLAARSPTWRK
jgi:hypothetical protein